MPSAMSRPPNEKASEMRKIHIPIFPGVAVPYCASGGQAAVAWPCSWAAVLLTPHLRFGSVVALAACPALPRPRAFRYLIEADDAEGRDDSRIRVSRSHPGCGERRGRAPSDLGGLRRLDRRMADLVGVPHAPA